MEVSGVRTRALLVLAALAGLLLGPAAPAWAVGPAGGPRTAAPDAASSSSPRTHAAVSRVARERAAAPAVAVDLVGTVAAAGAGSAHPSAGWAAGAGVVRVPAAGAAPPTTTPDDPESAAAAVAQGRAPPRTTGT